MAVLVATTIGVLPRTIVTMRGTRTSTMATRTTTIRTTHYVCVLSGLFNYLCDHSGGLVA
ncbi:MAG: hypothetical protein V1779_05895 [bacterium]